MKRISNILISVCLLITMCNIKVMATQRASAQNKITKIIGKIYKDGSQIRSANFLNVDGKIYISLNDIIPSLTNYSDNQIKFFDNSLYIGTMPNKGVIDLTNLRYFEKQGSTIYFDKWTGANDNRNFIINNQRFFKGIASSREEPWVKYKLNCKYSTLKFKLGIDDHTIGHGESKGGIAIIGDGNVLYDSGLIEAQEDVIEKEVNVSGVKVVEIRFNQPKNSNDNYVADVVIADPILVP